MATLNLGNIKFNWKGAYAGGTAYVVDDVVSYSGSSYICKLASTGNLPTNGTYWDQMSSAGTDGTDLTSTLTTQGDILYRDGSGLQRLAAGTAGQALKTGGAGANPTWGDVTTAVLGVASYTSGTRNSSMGGSSYINIISGNFTKSSASSKLSVICTYSQFSEQNGAGTARFVFGTSTEYSGTSYGNTSGHQKMVTNQYYFSNNTQTGSIAFTYDVRELGGSILLPSNSDDARIDNNRKAVVTIIEHV